MAKTNYDNAFESNNKYKIIMKLQTIMINNKRPNWMIKLTDKPRLTTLSPSENQAPAMTGAGMGTETLVEALTPPRNSSAPKQGLHFVQCMKIFQS